MIIKPKYMSAWIAYIRKNPADRRFLECFWESQLESKSWLIDQLKSINPNIQNIAIFGGWYGVLAQLFEMNFSDIDSIETVDIDPFCTRIFSSSINISRNIKSVQSCMSKYIYNSDVDCVVNTSTEHVDKEIYEKWWNNIPTGCMYAIQGNNLAIGEHIRTSLTLQRFLTDNLVNDPLFSGKILCPGPEGEFERYMAIGYK